MTTGSGDPRPVRTVFFGNDPWSVPSLRSLANAPNARIELVVTNPPRPAGRGGRLRSTAVADASRELGLATREVESTRDQALVHRLRSLAPDGFVVVAYGELLRGDLLTIPAVGSVNVHFSLLPRWRGASPVQHAILAGDAVTGVTLMLMDEGLDTGPILVTSEVPIGSVEDAGSLGDRLAELGAELLPPTLTELAAGRIRPVPQAGPPSNAPKLGPDARRLGWNRAADEVVRQIRAFAPQPGAASTWRGERIKVLRAEVTGAPGGPPGTVVSVDADGVTVAAGSGAVRLLDVAPAGRRQMSAAAWARGAHPRPGESFA